MDSLADVGSWIANNEALLSGIAAMIVVAGVVYAPLGAGLRRFLVARSHRQAEPIQAVGQMEQAQGPA